ncbi:MAG: histidinol-phosphatase [Chloroflexi bacterium]|nr:histidinol-phosphatase [Chloroflexota bacterium]
MSRQVATTSYHNHPGYCDGSGTVSEYAEAALALGLRSLGLSCHSPVPFPSDWNMPLERLPTYCADVAAAQTSYRDRLPILLGLELDYLDPSLATDVDAFQRAHILSRELDYVVASVHYIGRERDGRPFGFDSTAESFARQVEQVYAGDARRLVEDYYAEVAALARHAPSWALPVIVGHVDKIKIWNAGNRYFDENAGWYAAALDEALRAIAAAGLVVELNTAGFGRAHGEPYPGPAVLRRCLDLQIPVTVNADAHRPDNVARCFDEAVALLREVGFGEIVGLANRQWVAQPLY